MPLRILLGHHNTNNSEKDPIKLQRQNLVGASNNNNKNNNQFDDCSDDEIDFEIPSRQQLPSREAVTDSPSKPQQHQQLLSQDYSLKCLTTNADFICSNSSNNNTKEGGGEEEKDNDGQNNDLEEEKTKENLVEDSTAAATTTTVGVAEDPREEEEDAYDMEAQKQRNYQLMVQGLEERRLGDNIDDYCDDDNSCSSASTTASLNGRHQRMNMATTTNANGIANDNNNDNNNNDDDFDRKRMDMEILLTNAAKATNWGTWMDETDNTEEEEASMEEFSNKGEGDGDDNDSSSSSSSSKTEEDEEESSTTKNNNNSNNKTCYTEEEAMMEETSGGEGVKNDDEGVKDDDEDSSSSGSSSDDSSSDSSKDGDQDAEEKSTTKSSRNNNDTCCTEEEVTANKGEGGEDSSDDDDEDDDDEEESSIGSTKSDEDQMQEEDPSVGGGNQQQKSSSLVRLPKIGSRIAVYWTEDNEYYEGEVTKKRRKQKVGQRKKKIGSSNKNNSNHKNKNKNLIQEYWIEYDDGDTEWLDLTKHKFKILAKTKTRAGIRTNGGNSNNGMKEEEEDQKDDKQDDDDNDDVDDDDDQKQKTTNKKGQRVTWETRYKELVAYKERYGSDAEPTMSKSITPAKYHPLAFWLSTQRSLYRRQQQQQQQQDHQQQQTKQKRKQKQRQTISKEHEKLLRDLGCLGEDNDNTNGAAASIDDRRRKLHGSDKRPSPSPPHPSSSSSSSPRPRSSAAKRVIGGGGQLEEQEQEEQTPSKKKRQRVFQRSKPVSWEVRLEQLKQFQKRVGHLKPRLSCQLDFQDDDDNGGDNDDDEDNADVDETLYYWLENQRSHYRNGIILSLDQIQLLRQMGTPGFEEDLGHERYRGAEAATSASGARSRTSVSRATPPSKLPQSRPPPPSETANTKKKKQTKKRPNPTDNEDKNSIRSSSGGKKHKSFDPVPWETRYDELVAFKTKFGHLNVDFNNNNSYKGLAGWLALQQTNFRIGNIIDLPQPRISLLRNLGCRGFIMNSQKRVSGWELKIQQLKDFRNKFGHVNPQATATPSAASSSSAASSEQISERQLAIWLINERTNYEMGISILPPGCLQALRDLGCHGFEEEQEESGVGLPIKSSKEAVPAAKAPPAAATTTASNPASSFSGRTERTFEKMKSQISVLPSTESPTAKATWDERLAQLKAYKIQHGGDEPKYQGISHVHFGLAQWLSAQKIRYNNGSLSPDRRRKLLSIQCDLGSESRDQKQQAGGRKQANDASASSSPIPAPKNHQQAPSQSKPDESNNKTSNDLNRALRQPSQEKRTPISWETRFLNLQAYKARHGHANPTMTKKQGSETDYELGRWLSDQRAQFRKGTLRPEKLKLLLNIGCTGFENENKSTRELDGKDEAPADEKQERDEVLATTRSGRSSTSKRRFGIEDYNFY